MSKVESFYWNKLSSKSRCFELEQFFDLCFVLFVQGAALITSSTYIYCVVIQKEFSRKVGINKVKSFTGIKSTVRDVLLNQSSFMIYVQYIQFTVL